MTAEEIMADVPSDGVGSFLRPERLSEWAWVLGYAAVLTSLAILRYQLWLTTGFDVGWYEQGLWLILHQGPLAVSSYLGYPVLANEAAYILIPLAPLYALFGVGFLFALQSFALGVGYYILRRIGDVLMVPSQTAHFIGIAYLLFPTLLGANLFDFHVEALAVPLLLGLLWAHLAHRDGLFVGFLLLLSLMGDTTLVMVLATGLVLVFRGDVKAGLGAAAFSLAVLVFDLAFAIPHLASGLVPQWAPYAGMLGPSGSVGAVRLVTDPALLVGWIRHLRSWEYLAWIAAVPLFLTFWLGRRRPGAWWVPVLVLLEANLLSGAPSATSPFDQLTLPAVPFLFLLALDAAAGGGNGRAPRRRLGPVLAVSLLFLGVFAVQNYRTDWRNVPPDGSTLSQAVAIVPPSVPVVTQNFIEPRLADRPEEWTPALLALRGIRAGTYIVLDRNATDGITPAWILRSLQGQIARPGEAELLFNSDGITVARLLKGIPREVQAP